MRASERRAGERGGQASRSRGKEERKQRKNRRMMIRIEELRGKTGTVLRMANRKWKETKQLPSMLSGPALHGCCLVSFHILWAILSTSTVVWEVEGACKGGTMDLVGDTGRLNDL